MRGWKSLIFGAVALAMAMIFTTGAIAQNVLCLDNDSDLVITEATAVPIDTVRSEQILVSTGYPNESTTEDFTYATSSAGFEIQQGGVGTKNACASGVCGAAAATVRAVARAPVNVVRSVANVGTGQTVRSRAVTRRGIFGFQRARASVVFRR